MTTEVNEMLKHMLTIGCDVTTVIEFKDAELERKDQQLRQQEDELKFLRMQTQNLDQLLASLGLPPNYTQDDIKSLRDKIMNLSSSPGLFEWINMRPEVGWL